MRVQYLSQQQVTPRTILKIAHIFKITGSERCIAADAIRCHSPKSFGSLLHIRIECGAGSNPCFPISEMATSVPFFPTLTAGESAAW
jgi:hypothetical protein